MAKKKYFYAEVKYRGEEPDKPNKRTEGVVTLRVTSLKQAKSHAGFLLIGVKWLEFISVKRLSDEWQEYHEVFDYVNIMANFISYLRGQLKELHQKDSREYLNIQNKLNIINKENGNRFRKLKQISSNNNLNMQQLKDIEISTKEDEINLQKIQGELDAINPTKSK